MTESHPTKAVLLSALMLASIAAYAGASGPFQQSHDSNSGETHYAYTDDDCHVSLTLFSERGIHSHIMAARRDCPLGLAHQIKIIGSLLSQVKDDGGLERVELFAWGPIHLPELKERFSLGCLASPEWQALYDPETGRKGVELRSAVATDVLNEALVFQELVELFEEIDLRLWAESIVGIGIVDIGDTSELEIPEFINTFEVPDSGHVWFRVERP